MNNWQPMETAPKEGYPIQTVELRYVRNGVEVIKQGHWAYGDGDGMIPPFGPAWFEKQGSGFVEIAGEPTGWRPIAQVEG